MVLDRSIKTVNCMSILLYQLHTAVDKMAMLLGFEWSWCKLRLGIGVERNRWNGNWPVRVDESLVVRLSLES